LDGSDLGQRVISGPDAALSARRQPMALRQRVSITVLALLAVAAAAAAPGLTWRWLTGSLWLCFLLVVGFKAMACLAPATAIAPLPNRPRRLPGYTVVVALKDEAPVVAQLIRRLARLQYPSSRLTGFLVVEPDDKATVNEILKQKRPAWLHMVVAPPGEPTTKPRALNVALNLAQPGLLTVYDAEDEPHPEQLLEAAARFAAAGPELACLQAPLRIRTLGRRPTWLERQFALEYAALFDVVLPALARLGFPLPLGGTSNHFRVDVLKAVGGWDPWNVTEDADLGFRLARNGYRIGVLSRATRESPPPNIRSWIPQRTRWLKGFMQTLSVHLRRPQDLNWRGLASLFLTLGAAVASACLQGWVLAWLTASALVHAFNQTLPPIAWQDSALVMIGWSVAAWTCAVGARRAEAPFRLGDVLSAPIYWSLTTLAQGQAVWRLIRQPYYWDKTPHLPDIVVGRTARRVLRNHASLPTLPSSPIRTLGPWKFSISKTTPTSARAPSSATAPKTSRACERPDA